VAKFDADSDQTAVVSERLWHVTLAAREGPAPKRFLFGTAKVDGAEMTYQRYHDADLVAVSQEVDLEQGYGQAGLMWLWLIAGGLVLFSLLAVGAVFLLLRKPKFRQGPALELPGRLTPFTVLGLLQRVQQQYRLSEAQRAELAQALTALERHYFAGESQGENNLRALAEHWVRQGKMREE